MDTRSLSRRRFAKNAALFPGGAGLVRADVPTSASSEEEARLANIVRQYGSRLSTDQVKHLRRILEENGRMLEAVRSFSLANGDPPASVLKLHPDSGN